MSFIFSPFTVAMLDIISLHIQGREPSCPFQSLIGLTNDQFDKVEIRALSCFGVLPMRPACRPHRSGLMPVRTHTQHTSVKSTLVEVRSICYCGSAMAVTQSCTPNGQKDAGVAFSTPRFGPSSG
jgi:hypothetical protein